MLIEEEKIKEQLKELSLLARRAYGIREKQRVSFRDDPEFVTDVVKDITNISYNLAVADHVSSEVEKELTLLAFRYIFYPHGQVNSRFLQTISSRFDAYQNTRPEIGCPIHMVLQAQKYDAGKAEGERITPRIQELIMDYAEALVMSDGFQSVREFDVLETFRFWVMEGK